MIIGEDPKYRQICAQGICSLEIRKPGNFDGGVYTCKAKNDHGEALVSCKLEVKRKSISIAITLVPKVGGRLTLMVRRCGAATEESPHSSNKCCYLEGVIYWTYILPYL